MLYLDVLFNFFRFLAIPAYHLLNQLLLKIMEVLKLVDSFKLKFLI